MPSPQKQRGMKMTLATAFKTLHQAFSTCFCIPARCFQAPGFKTISQSMGLRVTWCMLGSWPSQQRRGFFLLGWYVGSSGSMEGRLQPVSVLVQRGGGAGLSPPSLARETQLHGNSFWEGEKRNKAKPSPPSCAQVPWGFALGEGPAGTQYFHYRRNSPPRQGLIPILPSWPSSLGIIYRF